MVVFVGHFLAAEDAEGGFLLHLLLAVRAVAGLGLPAGNVFFLTGVQDCYLSGFAVIIIFNGGVEGVGSQVGAVELVGGQAP
jgi:hypothetical protein